jgi:hypothetical protein
VSWDYRGICRTSKNESAVPLAPQTKCGRLWGQRARAVLKGMLLNLSRIELAAADRDFDKAAAEFQNYRYVASANVGAALRAAEPWSLFNPKIHDAHYAAMRQMKALQTAAKPDR